jgi:SRSO17 transposase
MTSIHLADATTQIARFSDYIERLAKAVGHQDRQAPFKAYCTGLLLPGARKSIEPMAARLAPGGVSRMHQSLHHLVSDSPWPDDAVIREINKLVLPGMERQSPGVAAWIVGEQVFLKRGAHSVGTVRQPSFKHRRVANCRIAVTLILATWQAGLPVGWRLYLPESWLDDPQKRSKAGIPDDVQFQTKVELALSQIRRAAADRLPEGVVLSSAGYGSDPAFRTGVAGLAMKYVAEIQAPTIMWLPGEPWKSAGDLALAAPEQQWKDVVWSEGGERTRRSRFAAMQVNTERNAQEWLLVEWPRGKPKPSGFWLSNMPPNTKLRDLVRYAKHYWTAERVYEELETELGLGHFEGRTWRGFHHHFTLCAAAYGFLASERCSWRPDARVGNLELDAPVLPQGFHPRGSRAAAAPNDTVSGGNSTVPNSINY